MNKPQINKTRRLCLCTLFAMFLTVSGAFGQTRDEDIMKLFRVSGTDKIMEQTLDAMLAQFKQMLPQVPADTWARVGRKFNTNEMLRLLVPVYAKHYTHNEIKQLITFYESPIGRKMVQVQPAMMQETMTIGQKYGELIGQELMSEIGIGR